MREVKHRLVSVSTKMAFGNRGGKRRKHSFVPRLALTALFRVAALLRLLTRSLETILSHRSNARRYSRSRDDTCALYATSALRGRARRTCGICDIEESLWKRQTSIGEHCEIQVFPHQTLKMLVAAVLNLNSRLGSLT